MEFALIAKIIAWFSERPILCWTMSVIVGVLFEAVQHWYPQQYDDAFTLPVVLLATVFGFTPAAFTGFVLYFTGLAPDTSLISVCVGAIWMLCLSGTGGWLNSVLRSNVKMLTELDIRAHESDAQFRVLVDGIKDHSIILLDADGRVKTWNSGAERIHAWPAEAIIGESIKTLYGAGHEDEADEVLRLARERGTYTMRSTRMRHDGTDFLAEVSVTALRDRDGGLQGYAKITRDVTALEQMEQDRRMVQVGHTAASVAHEFNNLLQVIVPNLEMIDDAHLSNTEIAHAATRARKAAVQAVDVAGDLLRMGRKDEPNEPDEDVGSVLNLRPVTASKLFETLGQTLMKLPPNVALRTLHAPGLPAFITDEEKLARVCANLIYNARDAMPTGGDIVVEAAAAPADVCAASDITHPCIQISVWDNGSGIPPALLSRVTKPFFTTKPAGRGTGLGLPIAKDFAERSGGKLIIESEEHCYTRVSLYLPAEPPPAETKPEEADRTCDAAGPETIRHLTVMVVDDDALVRETVAVSLRRAMINTIEVETGEAGLAILESKSKHIDFLVIDFGLKGISGADVIRKARQLRPDLPAVLITGSVGDLGVEQDPTTRILHKPFKPGALIAVLATLRQERNSNG